MKRIWEIIRPVVLTPVGIVWFVGVVLWELGKPWNRFVARWKR